MTGDAKSVWQEFGISLSEASELVRIIEAYTDRDIKVGIFGSRATGRFRPNSDIDLVFYGSVEIRMLHRLITEFEESSIGVSVDIVIYDANTEIGLKQQIDLDMKLLPIH